jgi:ribonuclease HII
MNKRFDPSLLPPAPNISFEKKLWNAGIEHVAGIDEAGRGALAGPVAAAAVILPPQPSIVEKLNGLKDSKQLTASQRVEWAEYLRSIALAWGIGFASHTEIDQQGIVPATRLAVQRALANSKIAAQHLLLDYLFLPDDETPQTNLIKGDERSLSIAGASILAKTARDKLLIELESEYPGYRFAQHKGYGTSQHLDALDRLGPSPIHRFTFAPIKESTQTLRSFQQ